MSAHPVVPEDEPFRSLDEPDAGDNRSLVASLLRPLSVLKFLGGNLS
jgi:hypothetical protein